MRTGRHKRVLIVGGMAGGASCAARLRRLDEQADIVVFERAPYVSLGTCGLPYWVGNAIPEEKRLFVASPALLKERFRIDVRTERIDVVEHQVLQLGPLGQQSGERPVAEQIGDFEPMPGGVQHCSGRLSV